MHTKFLLSLTIIINLILSSCQAQSLELAWKFSTEDKILASPAINNDMVFVGGQDGVMYALNRESGTVVWSFDTKGIIQAEALVTDEIVFFESANVFYAVEKMTGKEIWRHDLGMEPHSFAYQGKTYPYKIDPFDDKRSIAVTQGKHIYVGGGDGAIYVFNAKNGKVVMQYETDDKSPVRSTPLVDQGVLYYGDWAGKVYAVDLKSGTLIWKKRTYRGDKPYPTFGGVVSSFVSYKDLLFFGARNHMMNVLLSETGEKEWTYTDPQGGWMIGDPVIYKDTLYIGGSDNFSMYAFEPNFGRYLWQHNGGKNIYTRPVVTENYVIYTAGNGYNWTDKGVLFVLDRMSGKELIKYEVPMGVFSSPVMYENLITFGCYDGHVYTLRLVE